MSLLVALAGGVGAVARFVLDSVVAARARRSFPLGTIVVNVLGSFLLGLLVGWVRHRGGTADLRAVLGTGFLGGFTTFSTASIELVRLVRAGRPGTAAALAGSMVLISVLGAVLGLWLGGLPG